MLFVGLFLSIPQVKEKEREPGLLGIMREIWISIAKIYLDVKIERCQFSLSKLSILIRGCRHSFIVQCCCHLSGSNC